MESVRHQLPTEIVVAISTRFALDEEQIRRATVFIQEMTAAALVRVAEWRSGRKRLGEILHATGGEYWVRDVARTLFESNETQESLRGRASTALDGIFEADRLALTAFFSEKTGLPTKPVSHIFSYSFAFLLASLPPAEAPEDAHAEFIIVRLRREWELIERQLSDDARAFLDENIRVRRRGLESGGYPAVQDAPTTRSSLPPSTSDAPDGPARAALSYIREILGMAPEDDVDEG